MKMPVSLAEAGLSAEHQIDEVSVRRAVTAERVRVFTDRAVAGALSSPFGTLLLAVVIGPTAGWGRAALWLMLVNLGELLILGYGYRYRKALPDNRDSEIWARRQIMANSLTGLAWGCSVWVMAVDPLSPLYLFNISVLVGASALCVVIMSAFRTGMLLFALAVLLPLLLHLIYVDHPDALKLGAGLVILFALELQYGAVARRQLIEGLDARERAHAFVEQLSLLRNELFMSNRELAEKNDELCRALERVNELATRDELTGAYNRRVLVEQLERQVVYKDRYGSAASLVMIDLDHFKDINDSHGHAVGDQALRLVVGTLGAELREGDLLARFGGEEFLVLLPLTGGEAARMLAERLRCAVAGIELADGARMVPLRASFGVAELAAGERVGGWLRRADLALYTAKREGRNRVAEAD